jgi:lipopolysaccharide/colanic/teichoic acid biosynthesis glycosyltransferase
MPQDTANPEYVCQEQSIVVPPKPSFVFVVFKHTIDIITSLILLPITIAVCILVLILNPFLNRGTLFYTQERVGKNNRVFKIYKLRTMLGESEKPKFGTEESSRITPLGKFMRDIHIDELPQIVNVLFGDMSLIGPRPEQLEFFQKYVHSIQGFVHRQSVRPGVSGLAQLHYGYTDTPMGAKNKLKWDLEYIRHQGFALEIQIYLRTFEYIFPRIGRHLIGLGKSNTSADTMALIGGISNQRD